jgi:hypothetical protein
VKVDEIEALPPETLFEAVEKGQKNTASIRSLKITESKQFH